MVSVQSLMGWIGIAGRDGVGTIYYLIETMRAIDDNLRHGPKLRDLIDKDAKRQATKAFKRHFPVAENIRDVTAHSFGEIYGTLAGRAKHALPGGNLTISSVHGDIFETTFDGKLLQVAINAETAARLAEVRDLYWWAFAPLDGYQRACLEGASHLVVNP